MGFEYDWEMLHATSPSPSRSTHTSHSASWGLFIWRVIDQIPCVGNGYVAVHMYNIHCIAD